MKMTTTLLVTLLLASTGAVADKTTLTEQDKLLMDRAAILQMSNCIDANILMLQNNRKLLTDIEYEYNRTWHKIRQLGLDNNYKDQISTDELTSALVTYCMPKARN
ncbi:hypothetical protein [Vibrio caribbeanicus]|uniref:hypothetical protein n=1 Tax=Vibrio caribbeanicus TaxID=701175 RepID=UPI002284871D|nr:hypothetical protein [Vibrio caribbeanicus]MCY9845293.1 hypothetical protein [Vibrio caribbeanicus]